MPERPGSPLENQCALRAEHLLPLDLFVRLRPSLRPAIAAMRAARRLRLGPYVCLSFENRQTVLWHLHEVLRVERRTAQHQIEEETRRYDCLLARPGELRATLMIDGGPPDFGQRLSRLVASGRGAVSLRVGSASCVADCVETVTTVDSPLRYIRFETAEAGISANDLRSQPVELALHVEPQVQTSAPRELGLALAADLDVGALLEHQRTHLGGNIGSLSTDEKTTTELPREPHSMSFHRGSWAHDRDCPRLFG